ncbi:fragmin60, partial [Coprinopsis sp. MPI-PUGE-AT-0042]
MAYLNKPTIYNIEDTNIALLGSDLEKRVRENAGNEEPAWTSAGTEAGLRIWRVEKFQLVEWPESRYGTFYSGDSYIILNTYKPSQEAKDLSYNLHFWLGANTTVDEAGTAAYKTVELDDHLHGKPVQYREVQGSESAQLLSYFPKLVCLEGGVATGFRKVEEPPPPEVKRLYRIMLSRTSGEAARQSTSTLIIREVPPSATSLVAGEAYILDKGDQIWQLNTASSAGQERYKAAEFAQSLIAERKGQCALTVFDEGQSGASRFLAEFGEGTELQPAPASALSGQSTEAKLFKISDSSGKLELSPLSGVSRTLLSSGDVYLVDDSSNKRVPALYAWIGKEASMKERRSVLQYAQSYLYQEKDSHQGLLGVPLVKTKEGEEPSSFWGVFYD